MSFFLSGYPLLATVGMLDDLPSMSRRSGMIADVRVLSQEVREDAKKRIITLTKLQVDEGLKGISKGEILTLYQVGGSLNGRVMHLEGSSVYRPGERLVWFGFPLQENVVSYGLGLGKFKVVSGERGLEVFEELGDLKLARRPHTYLLLANPSPRHFKSLERFKAVIRSAL
ncbi:MAG: hypothetical protein I8H75_01930 [Myxococcaceae bacterium]|nr:hypothetical protein [Myxococcaceae bacterium]MBH2006096.1 hypothetical protein [Myxococcaceae bacterium]